MPPNEVNCGVLGSFKKLKTEFPPNVCAFKGSAAIHSSIIIIYFTATKISLCTIKKSINQSQFQYLVHRLYIMEFDTFYKFRFDFLYIFFILPAKDYFF